MRIAEEGSVSRAAEKLRLGQPTLSAQLKQFEDAMGVQLFERQHKKLILSEQGKIALEYARTIFKLGNEMYEVLHDKMPANRVHVQIGALDSIPKSITLKLTQAAMALGKCQVSLREGHPDEIIRELTAHRIDLVVTNFIPVVSDAKSLIHKSLSKKQVAIYGAPKFKGLKKGFPESLRDQSFVLPTFDSKIRYDIDHWLKTRSLAVDIVAETQDVALKNLMATEGIGLIATSGNAVMGQVQQGSLVEIGKLDGVFEELFLVSAQRKVANPIAKELMRNFQFA